MTMLHTYLSSSSGNLYEVNDGSTRLMLECGCTFSQLQKLAGYRTGVWAGCLITHEHGDHAKSAKMLHQRGVKIYATEGTLDAIGLGAVKTIKPVVYMEPVEIGTFSVMPFRTIHNAQEPCGYVIRSNRIGECLVFATDTYKIPYRFTGVTEIAVEANYTEKLLETNTGIPDVVLNRIRHSHLSLESCLEFLRAQDLSKCERITLVHLSRARSSADEFREVIQQETKIETIIA